VSVLLRALVLTNIEPINIFVRWVTMYIEDEAVFLLHSRKYTDSRILIETLTARHGRISAVARQSYGKNKTESIQLFTPYVASWRGKKELRTITSIEASGAVFPLVGKQLYCGFYLNELLLRSLPQDDSAEAVFELYANTLQRIAQLSTQDTIEIYLRNFEMHLLRELGFGLDLSVDCLNNAISPDMDCWYRFVEGEGLVPERHNIGHRNDIFPARVLCEIRDGRFDSKTTLKFAKRLCRCALSPIIGDKPIRARELFL